MRRTVQSMAGQSPVPGLLVGAATILFLLAILFSTAPDARAAVSNGAWTWANQLPQGNTLNAVSFATDGAGWVVGAAGAIMTTADGGDTWTGQVSGTGLPLNDVCFVSTAAGWAVGNSGTILSTSDGGTTWIAQASGTTQNLNGVSFTTTTTGWAVGDAGTILCTTDGGATWTAQSSGVTTVLCGVAAVGSTTAYAVGASGVIRKTSNGTTWAGLTSGTSTTLCDVCFPETATGYVVGANGVIRKTTTGGASWSSLTSGTTSTIWDVSFAGTQVGWAAVADGGVLYTGNGSTWTAQTSGTTQHLYGISSPHGSESVAVGAGGTITTTSNGSTWAVRTVGADAAATTQLNDCCLAGTSSTVGFAVGRCGSIWTTANGGQNWTEQVSGEEVESTSINAVAFPGIDTGYAVSSRGDRILATTNRGISWTKLATTGLDKATYLYGVAFPTLSTGWVVGRSGTILKTTDSGSSWTVQSPGGLTLYDIAFTSTAHGCAVGAHGAIWTTTDGDHWISRVSGTARTLNDVALSGADVGYAVGDGGVIVKTTDGGVTWSSVDSGITTTLNSVAAPSATVIYVAGSNGLVRMSTDGGETWSTSETSVARNLFALAFSITTSGLIVGAGGACLYTANGGVAPAPGSNDAPSGWCNHDVIVTLTPLAGSTPIAFTQFRVDGGGWTLGTNVFVAAPTDHGNDGVHAIEYYSTDTMGQHSRVEKCTVRIDTCGPTTSGTGLAANDYSDWHKTTPVGCSFPASDSLSGVASTEYGLNDDAPVVQDAQSLLLDAEETDRFRIVDDSSTLTWDDFGGSHLLDGSYRVEYWSTDLASNEETHRLGYMNIDTVKPSVTGDAPTSSNTWVLVTLTPSDATSGIARTQYREQVTGVWGSWATAANNQFAIAAPANGTYNGSHNFQFQAVDNAGNVSSIGSFAVNIQAMAPVTTAIGVAPDIGRAWGDAYFSFQALDGQGDLDHTYYEVDDGLTLTDDGSVHAVSPEGSHKIEYWSVDSNSPAVHEERHHVGYVNFDVTKPTCSAAAPLGWNTTDAVVTLTAADDASGHVGSGVARTEYRLLGATDWTTAVGDKFTVGAPASGSNDGVRNYEYRAVDNAGYATDPQTCSVWIDAGAPVTTATGMAADNHSGWGNGTFKLTATDAGSGVAGTHYTVDGGSAQSDDGSSHALSEGSHAILYWSEDTLGHVEESHLGYVNYDATRPTCSDGAPTGWSNTSVTVPLTGVDSGSGVVRTEYRASGATTWTTVIGNQFVVSAPTNGSNDGAHVYEYHAVDAAGLVGDTGTCTVRIDTRPPATTASGLAANNHSNWGGGTFSFSGSDASSGVAHSYYMVDGGPAQADDGGTHAVWAEGSHTITYWSVDAAGNIETQHSAFVNCDVAPPTCSTNAPAAPSASTVTVTVVATDTASGVAKIQYRAGTTSAWADGSKFTVAAPSSGSNNGDHVYQYRALDLAGHWSDPGTCVVTIAVPVTRTLTVTGKVTGGGGTRATAWTAPVAGASMAITGSTVPVQSTSSGAYSCKTSLGATTSISSLALTCTAAGYATQSKPLGTATTQTLDFTLVVKPTKVQLTVRFGGKALKGAKVSCFGKVAKTNAKGLATLALLTMKPLATYPATVTKPGFKKGKLTLKSRPGATVKTVVTLKK